MIIQYDEKANLQKQLDKLYNTELNKNKLNDVFTIEQQKSLSAPFIINIPENYNNAQIKMLYVGKETNKWWGTLEDFIKRENSINILKDRYSAELFGGKVLIPSDKTKQYKAEPNWNNSFFVEYKKIRKHLFNDEKGSIIWSNLLKFDNQKSKSYSRNTINNKSVVDISKEIFLKELEILKPDYIIFPVSYTYDKIIKYFFKNIKTIKIFESKSLWKFKIGNIICYRTWHPSTIRYNANKNKLEYYKDIIEDIKIENKNIYK
jgi:hypothetical protein